MSLRDWMRHESVNSFRDATEHEQVVRDLAPMTTMLPALAPAPARLADVMPSCLAALSGQKNQLDLPPVDHAVVVLIDGLGISALSARTGHARFLNSFSLKTWARTAFPSTTAANLPTLTTGQLPGVHGLVGYTALDPHNDRIVNQLTGWDKQMTPDVWQRARTVFENASYMGIDTVAIGSRRYAHSGFTQAVLRGARYRGTNTAGETVDNALKLMRGHGKSLIYLYFPELDMAAHAKGLDSDCWLRELEKIDAEMGRLADGLGRRTGAIVTADHGMVDVPPSKHVYVNESPSLLKGVRHIGGEPRCLQLYLEKAIDAEEVAMQWRESEGSRSWVLTRTEAVSAGLFGEVDPVVLPRIGNVLIFARAQIAYYDTSRASKASLCMVGQHGSATDAETRVPLIRLGAFAM
jgi:predicted AlkP superfamily pyrophosphatase or phosphodiesterase